MVDQGMLILADAGIIEGAILSAVFSAALSLAVGLLVKQKPRTQMSDVLPNLSSRGSVSPIVRGRRRVGCIFGFVWGRYSAKAQGGSGAMFSGKRNVDYYESGVHVLCVGPSQRLYAIYANEKVIWNKLGANYIDRSTTPSGTTFHTSNGDGSSFTVYWGNTDQPVDPHLSAATGYAAAFPFSCFIVWHPRNIGPAGVWDQLEYDLECHVEDDVPSPPTGAAWLDSTIDAVGLTSYFNGGAAVPAGTYALAYVDGALRYSSSGLWHINGQDTDIFGRPIVSTARCLKLVDSTGAAVNTAAGNPLVPQSTARGFLTQSLCEAANSGASVNVTWGGGVLGIQCVDTTNNPLYHIAGVPAPTFTLTPVGGGTADTLTAVVVPVPPSSDNGCNPAWVLWEALADTYPHGQAVPQDNLDSAAFNAMSTEAINEHLPTNSAWVDGQDASKAISDFLIDIGCFMRQIGDQLSPLMIRPASGTIPTLTADVVVETAIPQERILGPCLPNRMLFTYSNELIRFKTDVVPMPLNGEAYDSGARRAKTTDIPNTNSPRTAQLIANRRLLEFGAQNITCKFHGTRQARLLEPGDPFYLPAAGDPFTRRVATKTYSPNSPPAEFGAILDQYTLASSGYLPSNIDVPPPNVSDPAMPDLAFDPIVLPALMWPTPGVPALAVARVRAANETSAEIWLSPDGSNYVDAGTQNGYAAGGLLQADLSSTLTGTGGTGAEFDGPEMAPLNADVGGVIDLSGDDHDYLAGQQLCLIDQEIFLIRGLTAQSDGGYTLTGLTRAMYGTVAADHPAGSVAYVFLQSELAAIISALLIPGATLYVKTQPTNNGSSVDITTVAGVAMAVPANLLTPPDSKYIASAAIGALKVVALINGELTIADNTSTLPGQTIGILRYAVPSGGVANVATQSQAIDGFSGLTTGQQYWLGTAGALTSTPPTALNALVQPIGIANSATELQLNLQQGYMIGT